MGHQYRTHLIDKTPHTWATLKHHIMEQPTPLAPRKAVIYRTWRGNCRLYEITGYGKRIEIAAIPDSQMEQHLISLKAAKDTKALDLFVATLEAQQS